MNNLPNSRDGVVTFISGITNKGIILSKGISDFIDHKAPKKLSDFSVNIIF